MQLNLFKVNKNSVYAYIETWKYLNLTVKTLKIKIFFKCWNDFTDLLFKDELKSNNHEENGESYDDRW